MPQKNNLTLSSMKKRKPVRTLTNTSDKDKHGVWREGKFSVSNSLHRERFEQREAKLLLKRQETYASST